MLPRTLTIQNFLSYGPEPQTLDFREFDLACLVGKNGVGKSSIIEALTWCLWGKARSGSDNELVHLGQKAMNVTMEFEVGSETYRVIRKRSVRGRGGTSLLEFQLLEGSAEDAQFRAITTPSIRETQTLITRTLGLSYETFVNSAYLRQGKADEFTTKRPADRKAILAEILGLTTYETLEARVRAQLSEQDEEATSRGFFLEQLRQDVVELPMHEAAMAEREVEAERLREAAAAAEAELAVWNEKVAQLALRRERAEATRQESEQLATDLRELEQERDRLQKEITTTEALLADRTRVEKDAEEARKARAALTRWNEKLERAHQLGQERFALERRLAELRTARETQARVLQGHIAQLRATLDKLAAERARVDATSDPEAELAALRASIVDAEQAQARAQEQARAAAQKAEALKLDGERVKAKRAALKGADAACPLCTQALSPDHRRTVEQDYDERLATCRTQYAEEHTAATAAATTAEEQEALLARLRPQVRVLEAKVVAAAGARALLEHAERAQTELASREAELAAAEGTAPSPEETAAVEELTTVERKIAMDKYDPAGHATAQETAERTAPALERATALATATEHLDAVRERHTAVLERMALRKERLAALTAEREELTRALEGEAIVRKTVADRLAAADAAREALRAAEHVVVDQRARVTALQEKAARAAALETELGTIGEQRALLDELRACFGRNGIPAMLIESAIPEIEERANEILGRMSDYQFTIRLDVTREKRSGAGTIETLDIRIADAVGTRDYELYSGGEAFRINFAIRVALSHLLARRAGTHLRLLVIDEGFGSLDTLGRETLVGVLNAVRTEFEKVLVITHIQELKDAFSYQIQVEKRDGTSVLVRE